MSDFVKDINVPTNDCISRQAAIDAIIEDKIGHNSLKIMTAIGDGDKAETLNMTCDRHAKMLMDLPSAQPEIIRCKDCKYITEHYDTDGNAPYWTCSEWDSGTDYDGFCHYAERRTDETD